MESFGQFFNIQMAIFRSRLVIFDQVSRLAYFESLSCPCGMLVSLTEARIVSHSAIVNGYQLLCDAQTVLEPHMGTAALFLFDSLSSFYAFSFGFLGASIFC